MFWFVCFVQCICHCFVSVFEFALVAIWAGAIRSPEPAQVSGLNLSLRAQLWMLLHALFVTMALVSWEVAGIVWFLALDCHYVCLRECSCRRVLVDDLLFSETFHGSHRLS